MNIAFSWPVQRVGQGPGGVTDTEDFKMSILIIIMVCGNGQMLVTSDCIQERFVLDGC